MKKLMMYLLVGCGVITWTACTDTPEGVTASCETPTSNKVFNSPTDIIASPDGTALYIVELDQNQIRKIDAQNLETLQTYPMPSGPTGIIANADATTFYVTASCPDGKLLILDANLKIKSVLPCGHSPHAPTLSPDGKMLAVLDRFGNKMRLYKVGQEASSCKIFDTIREPESVVFTTQPDDTYNVYVSNALPSGPANGDYTAAAISTYQHVNPNSDDPITIDSIPLLNGAINVKKMCISPDGRFLLAPMVVARYQIPTTRIDRAWLGTNSVAFIDLKTQKLYTTITMDDGQLGATNPWAVTFSKDGKTMIVLIAGSDELITIDYAALVQKIEKRIADINTPRRGKIKPPPAPEDDLGFIFEHRVRSPLKVRAPRAIAIIQDSIYTPGYFSDDIACVNLLGSRGVPPQHKAYGIPFEQLPQARRGEAYFCDGRFCFQQWLSCITCHPDGRADGLNWDLINDGFGNPKNTKSMLYSIYTPPCMSTGIRKDAEYAIRSGVKHIQFFQPDPAFEPELYGCMEEYFKEMKAVPSPRLATDGSLSPQAQRGKLVFDKAGCMRCHNGPYLTNMQQYDVGTTRGQDKGRTLDTPTLLELWRIAPYMHDGRTSSVRDVITVHNPQMRGNVKELTNAEINDLVEYLLSL